jgi:hypothetical protein
MCVSQQQHPRRTEAAVTLICITWVGTVVGRMVGATVGGCVMGTQSAELVRLGGKMVVKPLGQSWQAISASAPP